MNKITIRVPATSANLGPGFDTMGVALKLYNTIEVTAGNGPVRNFIEIEGEGKAVLPADSKNVVWQSMKKAFEILPRDARKLKIPVENIRLKLVNCIPLASGMGSSAAARLGGILAANELMGRKLSLQQILSLGSALEGHSDNIVPAASGSLCISSLCNGGVEYLKLPCPELKAVVCCPDFGLPTEKARKLLPKNVAFKTAVFNSTKAAFLIYAFTMRRYDLLARAMEDKLHQPYRGRRIPGMKEVFQAALRAGAYGAAISGAGPSLVALCPHSKARKVAESMSCAWKKYNVVGRKFVLDIDCSGSQTITK